MPASTAAALTPPETGLVVPPSPRPLNTLIAAARRITDSKIIRATPMNGREWQDEAWNMFDLVGEEHYLTNTLAGRMSQARLFVGMMPEDDTQQPEQVTTGPAADAFDALSTLSGRSQMIARLGAGLFVAGEGWVVGIPRHLMDQGKPDTGSVRTPSSPAARIAPLLPPPPEPSLEDLEWRVLSVSEVTAAQGDKVAIRCGEGKDGLITVDPDEVYLIRVWRPHPRLWHEADSPTRASLPVLRELTGLTMHVSAQVDSRLAGAGMLLVPASASAAVRAAAGQQPGDDSDPLTDALLESMIVPIRDRAAASALVPLVVTVPDDSIDKFKHMDFASRLDPEARGLREEAIRRLALGLDAPPEILLGTAAQNHWGAWLVREDVVSTHLEPPLALICDAITTQYLQPVLASGGMPPEQARRFVVWYDVSHLVTRPNKFADATQLHQAGVISDKAYRDAAGFGDDDAPSQDELAGSVERALQLVTHNAALAVTPGVMELAKQIARLSKMSEEQLAASALEPVVNPHAQTGNDQATGPDNSGTSDVKQEGPSSPKPPPSGPPAAPPSGQPKTPASP